MSRTLCIVGGGFSGAMTAANAISCAGTRGLAMRVVLIEERAQCGLGVAYSTQCEDHVLNVPCARMSAYADKPDHFLEWVTRRTGDADGKRFLPRRLFGEYVRQTLEEAVAHAPDGVRLEIVRSRAMTARRLGNARCGQRWKIDCADGRQVDADALVLALGHRAPGDPVSELWTGSRTRWIGDPWNDKSVAQIAGDEPVVVLGTGLTAVDVVLSLAGASDRPGRTRTAPISLVSRRGLLPTAHATSPGGKIDVAERVETLMANGAELSARALVKCVRESVRIAGIENWRLVIDGLRPLTHRIWRALPGPERVRFVRRVRTFWEIHRHRMAPNVAERIAELRRRGIVRVAGGRVERVLAQDQGLTIDVAGKDTSQSVEIKASWLINCTGPGALSASDASPLISSLLQSGHVQMDPLGLGLIASADGACVNAAGEKLVDLFVVGTLRKPDLWESTAVPELRVQAADVARRLVEFKAVPAEGNEVRVRARSESAAGAYSTDTAT